MLLVLFTAQGPSNSNAVPHRLGCYYFEWESVVAVAFICRYRVSSRRHQSGCNWQLRRGAHTHTLNQEMRATREHEAPFCRVFLPLRKWRGGKKPREETDTHATDGEHKVLRVNKFFAAHSSSVMIDRTGDRIASILLFKETAENIMMAYFLKCAVGYGFRSLFFSDQISKFFLAATSLVLLS